MLLRRPRRPEPEAEKERMCLPADEGRLNVIQIVHITADLLVSNEHHLTGPIKSDVILCHVGIWADTI